MKAVIFAAGEGRRMRPLTLEKPKPLLEVLGRPLIDYTFDALPAEVDEVVMVVGYKQEMFREYLGSMHGGKRITYVVQEKIGGVGEALFLAREHVEGGQFLTLYADDVYLRTDVEKALSYQYAMLLAPVADPTRFGVVEVDSSGVVIGIEEKPAVPKSNLVSTGIFKLDGAIFNYRVPQHENGEMYLAEMVGALAKDHEVHGIVSERWIQVGYPADLAKAEEILRNG
jgi:NDP-sugar pyrophosphorylase family protein